MAPKVLLDWLSEVLPIGIVVLVGVGIYFMKGHQNNMEKLYKLTLDQQKFSEERHRDYRNTLQADRDSHISFFEKRIDELRDEQKNLKAEVAQGRDGYHELHDRYLTLQEKVDSMLNERFDARDSTRDIISNLKESMEQLPDRDSQELSQLRQDVDILRDSLERMEQVDEETRDWLQDIRTYSRNRTSLAQRAAQHARSQI